MTPEQAHRLATASGHFIAGALIQREAVGSPYAEALAAVCVATCNSTVLYLVTHGGDETVSDLHLRLGHALRHNITGEIHLHPAIPASVVDREALAAALDYVVPGEVSTWVFSGASPGSLDDLASTDPDRLGPSADGVAE